jgi:hypothetical protein
MIADCHPRNSSSLIKPGEEIAALEGCNSRVGGQNDGMPTERLSMRDIKENLRPFAREIFARTRNGPFIDNVDSSRVVDHDVV